MKRRIFIRDTSLVAFSIGIFGKISWNGSRYEGDNATTTDILGPFYRPGAPFRSYLVLPGTSGQVIHLSGMIFQKDGKSPLKNAIIEIWHCDEKGVYDNTSDEYRYRAACKADENGKYYFKTILPVPYKTSKMHYRPAHIHMRISGAKHQDLITQIYFKGDPHIQEDMSSSSPLAIHRILDVSTNDKKEKQVKFDITMREEYPLEASAFKKLEGLYEMSDKSMAEFFKKGDLLFVKVNGQIQEGLAYKGNNHFESGMGYIKVEFELLESGDIKVKGSYLDDNKKEISIEGKRLLKYPQ